MLVFTTVVVMSTAAMFVFTTAGILFLTASLMRVIEDAVFAVGDVQLLAQTFHQLFGGKDAVLCQQLSKLFVGVRLIGEVRLGYRDGNHRLVAWLFWLSGKCRTK